MAYRESLSNNQLLASLPPEAADLLPQRIELVELASGPRFTKSAWSCATSTFR